VWEENFDGPEIDESSWTRIAKGGSDWDDMMSLRPDLAFIEDGQLVLLGKVNDHSSDDTTAFVTGGIWSSHKKAFQQARFEIRAKFNKVDGFWPALWLMPDVGLPSPNYAEIDIMEHLNAETVAYQTVHSHYTLHIQKEDVPQHSVKADIKDGDWNVYAVEVNPDSICFFINDKKTMTYPRLAEKEYQFPWPDYPFYIILSNQLGGGWVGPVGKPEQLPSELRVDWIKVYEKQAKE
jgi:beta-glucanase (GH16 family)